MPINNARPDDPTIAALVRVAESGAAEAARELGDRYRTVQAWDPRSAR